MLPCQNRSAPSPDSRTLSKSVFFWGWRFTNIKFESWAKKMAHLHEPIWRKAGIFEAVVSSTYIITKNTDLVLGIAEKWCPDTKTFVFPWGETAITLEDVMMLSGFSVLGSPVFATLDSSGEKIMAKLDKEWKKIKKDKVNFVSQVAWMERFMNSGDELEHVAFLVLWLNYFVFPSRLYHLYKAVLPIAVHLSSCTRIALAPAVLAHLYADLSLLKNHITSFSESTSTARIDLTALFKLVQVWTWERFKELQPKPNPMQKGQPRLARWHDLKQNTSNARQIFDNSKMDSFEWRPYTKTVKNWEFPHFYPEKAMWVPVSPNLDDDFISFARCFKVFELVGIDRVEHYFPNRVALQFGMLQDVPSPVNRNSISQEAAWNDYDKPIDDMTLYIPSRFAPPHVTQMFCEWRRKWLPEFKCSSEVKRFVESALKLEARNIIGDGTSLVPSGSKASRTSKDGIMNKRRKNMKRFRENDENNVGRCKTQVPSKNDKGDDSHTIASEPPGKNSRLEADNNDSGPCQKLASLRDDGDKTFPPPEMEQMNEKSNETGIESGKRMVLSPFNETNSSDPPVDFDGAMNIVDSAPETRQFYDDGLDVQTDEIGNKAGMVPSPFDENNSLDPPLGANRGVVDIVVLPLETRKTCGDELDVHGSYAEKMTMIDNGSKEPDCLLQEDGTLAGQKAISDVKLCSSEAEKEDETSKAYKSKVLNPSVESNIHIAVGEGSQGQDCLLHDNTLGSEETMKSNEDFEKRNNVFDFDADKDSAKKRIQELKVLELSIEKRIIKAQKNVALIIERRAEELRKIAAARLI